MYSNLQDWNTIQNRFKALSSWPNRKSAVEIAQAWKANFDREEATKTEMK